ncbi:MAG: hypothetical protein H7X80_04855 [bacterium]|nr:hypothetical protein [Candidatus Kapabacteria bacterium]
MIKHIALVATLLLILTGSAAAQERDSLRYIVLMKSGDSFRGNLVSHTDSTVTIRTEFGRVVIAKNLVDEFIAVDGPYLKRPNHFLMPTGSPNGPGGFISNYELGFYYGGFGLGNGATITAGATLIPGIALKHQLYHAGAKITVERNEDFDLALGASYTFITTDHPYGHAYVVGTFPAGTARYSVMILYRVSGEDFAQIALAPFGGDSLKFSVNYGPSVGAAFGFDGPAFGRDDMLWFGEIWNNDMSKPQNTVSLVGIRLMNENLSADFGIALFTAPFVAPVFSFTWRM